MESEIVITSWNLQGREGVDVDTVAATIVGLGSDVVLLQEVQRSQAVALADRLGWRCRWTFKHWTIVHPAEGLAILSREPLEGPRRVRLAHRWRFWSWRRRVALVGYVGAVTIVDVHLGSGVGDVERTRQARLVLDVVAADADTVVGGDLNTAPDSAVIATFVDAGFVDAWTSVHAEAPCPTNWRGGRRAGPPTQRLDYVLTRGRVAATDALVGDAAAPDWTCLAELSDHAPVTVTLAPRAVTAGP